MNDLTFEQQFFETNRDFLAQRYAGKVLIILGQKVVAVYENPSVAQREAAKEFRNNSYLIQQIERPPMRR